MRVFGLVLESYGKYVKVRTRDGEVIIKSDKKAPKEGTKIEMKDFGQGDYKAKVLAKRPGKFDELPNVRFIEISERLVDEMSRNSTNKLDRDDLVVNIALFIEELSKRIDVNSAFLQKFQKYMNGELDGNTELADFENYINLLSGRYGLKKSKNGIAFLNRAHGTFQVFVGDDSILGKIDGDSITLYFSKMPENVEELERNLRRSFSFVSFKLEGFVDGTYV
ncbi:MAG TPA: hypothetical protein PLM21_03040 [Fervidobacterium sp.]|nr:hypothetical protein [Fervidobacterium sp.]NLH38415.1 hypothetical protein [Thermotogaceae bacterium]HOK33376.1 hypothetical protein [Fervidobacterium sp.]HOL03944.1 hypothetical protein [Fervidobacterium sp.]HOS51853.1 hypothetical protein [Fervidobacterium sp.]